VLVPHAQVYDSIGVALTSLLVLTYTPFKFSYWGIVGGALWVFSQLFAFVAIRFIGYSVAVATWAGLTIVVSFLWGAIAFGQSVQSIGGSILALLTLLIGVFGVAACQSSLPETLRDWVWSGQAPPSDHRKSTALRHASADAADDRDGSSADAVTPAQRALGFGCAIVVGLLNGSLMVPFHYFQQSEKKSNSGEEDPGAAIAYLASLSLGIAMITAGCIVASALVRGQPVWHARVAAVPGIITGKYH